MPYLRSLLKNSLFLISIIHIHSAFSAERDYFYVTDQRAEDETSETLFLYINNHLVKTFHLDLNHDQIEAKIPLSLGLKEVHYTLCGEITFSKYGHIQTDRVSSNGILYYPNDHHYDAVASENFHNFFLIDYDDPESSESLSNSASLCTFSNS